MNAGGNRNALNKPFNGSGEREWSYSLFDCFGDASTFLISWCFPCVVYSQNKSRYEHLEQKGFPHPSSGDSISGDCFLYACLTGCCCLGSLLQMSTRGNIRRRYRIEGGSCEDCLAALCCIPCELTEGSRELELEEQSMGQHKG
ncbi:PLAC8 family-domain-containing protein [Hysterangium stoloniferum]|nr:PLAC8 family-domain-containing protein [Hysterangium stoloniferum]